MGSMSHALLKHLGGELNQVSLRRKGGRSCVDNWKHLLCRKTLGSDCHMGSTGHGAHNRETVNNQLLMQLFLLFIAACDMGDDSQPQSSLFTWLPRHHTLRIFLLPLGCFLIVSSLGSSFPVLSLSPRTSSLCFCLSGLKA